MIKADGKANITSYKAKLIDNFLKKKKKDNF